MMTLESTENAPNLERLTPPGTLGDAANAKKRRTGGLIGKTPVRWEARLNVNYARTIRHLLCAFKKIALEDFRTSATA